MKSFLLVTTTLIANPPALKRISMYHSATKDTLDRWETVGALLMKTVRP